MNRSARRYVLAGRPRGRVTIRKIDRIGVVVLPPVRNPLVLAVLGLLRSPLPQVEIGGGSGVVARSARLRPAGRVFVQRPLNRILVTLRDGGVVLVALVCRQR